MKKTMVAVAVMAGLMSVSSAHALEVVLTLDNWQAVAGSGSYGNDSSSPINFNSLAGFGTFRVVNDGGVNSPIFDMDKLIAMCLEPDELITVGNTYTFDQNFLEYSPTSDMTEIPLGSGNEFVGMGPMNEFLLSDFAESVGFVYDTDTNQLVTAVGDMTAEERGALSMLHWEAQDDVMDLASGDMRFTAGNTGYTMAQTFIDDWTFAAFPVDESWQGYGLNNIALGDTVSSTRNIYTGQDFAFYDYTDSREITIPEPASLALMGLGLIGLGFTKRNTRKS